MSITNNGANFGTGTAGQVLTSNGEGVAPTFQAAAGGGITTLDGDTGSATGSTVNVLGLVSPYTNNTLAFSGAGSTLTLLNTDSNNNIIIGSSVTTSGGVDCVLIGSGASLQTHDVVMGYQALSSTGSGNNVVVGYQAHSVPSSGGGGNIVIGSGATSTGNGDAVVIGRGASSAGNLAVVIGSSAGCSANAGVVVGQGSNVGLGGVVIGQANNITGNYGIALGNGNGNAAPGVMYLGTSGQTQYTWIYGINGQTVSNARMVTIDSSTSLMGTLPLPAAPVAQINFLATQLADQTNVTGDATQYTMTFTDVITNVGSGFDGTSTFTAPNTGLYYFTVNLYAENLVTATNQIIQLITTAATYRIFEGQWFPISQSAGTLLISTYSMIANMSSGDTATIAFTSTGASKTVSVAGATNAGFQTPIFAGYFIG